MVTPITTMKEFEEATKTGLAVIDFYATWCGPCKMISPKLEAMVSQYPSVKFYKVDVDEASDVAEHCKISAMPTFYFYKDGTKLEEDLKGASEAKLKELIEKLAS